MVKNEKVFKENFHMSVHDFSELYTKIEHLIDGEINRRPDRIPPKAKLAIVLEYLASGTLQRHMSSVYRISKQHFGVSTAILNCTNCIKLKSKL